MSNEINPFMERAIKLSQEGSSTGKGGPFGAVIVKDGKIVGEGWNLVLELNDPTAHAEVTAIRDATRKLCTPWLEGCELYTSCEPCPMCMCGALWARIKNIFMAATRDDAAAIGFDDAEFYDELQMDPRWELFTIESLSEIHRERAVAVMQGWHAGDRKQTY